MDLIIPLRIASKMVALIQCGYITKNIGVVIILANSDVPTKILLGQRTNSYKVGNVGLPGGRLELYERLHDAAARELLEETGVEARDMQCMGVVTETQPDMQQDFVHFIHVCRHWDGVITNAEPASRRSIQCYTEPCAKNILFF